MVQLYSSFQIVVDDVESTEYTLTGLDTYMEYTIQMTSSNKDGESDPSDPEKFRTMEERKILATLQYLDQV